MPNSVYPPPSPELSQKRRALAPDIEAAFDAFSQRVFIVCGGPILTSVNVNTF